MVTRGQGRGWGKQVAVVKEGTCLDEHCEMSGSAESPYHTPDTDPMPYVNYWN